jgi:predicted ATPase
MKDKLFDRAEEIGSPVDLKYTLEEIFFEDETIESVLHYYYISMHDRVQQVIEKERGQ